MHLQKEIIETPSFDDRPRRYWRIWRIIPCISAIDEIHIPPVVPMHKTVLVFLGENMGHRIWSTFVHSRSISHGYDLVGKVQPMTGGYSLRQQWDQILTFITCHKVCYYILIYVYKLSDCLSLWRIVNVLSSVSTTWLLLVQTCEDSLSHTEDADSIYRIRELRVRKTKEIFNLYSSRYKTLSKDFS